MASITSQNIGVGLGSSITNLVLGHHGQQQQKFEKMRAERDEARQTQMTSLLGPLAGVAGSALGGAAGEGLGGLLSGLFGGGGLPASAMGSDSFGQQASRNIPGGFGNPTYGLQTSPVWQNPSIGSNWNYITGQPNLPF